MLVNPPKLHQEIQTFAQQGIKDRKGEKSIKEFTFCLVVPGRVMIRMMRPFSTFKQSNQAFGHCFVARNVHIFRMKMKITLSFTVVAKDIKVKRT